MATAWKPNLKAIGGGAPVVKLFSKIGRDRFQIDLLEGKLTPNGSQIAHIKGCKDKRETFRELKKVAKRYTQIQSRNP